MTPEVNLASPAASRTGSDAARTLHDRASRVLPGGVTAAARANAAMGHPVYISRADGPFLYDLTGRRLIDTSTSNGASLLGHGHPAVKAAVNQALELGIACMWDGEPQIRLAERLVELIPAFELVRFTTSGTEATLYVTRIARTYTGRTKIVKFVGHFHGFNDSLPFNYPTPADAAGPTPAPRAETAGLPTEAESDVILVPFNEPAAFRAALEQNADQIAGVILEPINYDAGGIAPAPGFLELLRDETRRRGIVLIFDEILSGFRTGASGAQGYYCVTPDLSTLGKAVGGGVPLSVFGGRREIMQVVSPLGRAVHTGTYNANLIPIMAGHAFLDVIAVPDFFPAFLELHERLYAGLRRAFADAGLPVRVQAIGARFGLLFGLTPDVEVTNYAQAAKIDWPKLLAFCREMDARGVYVNPAFHHGLSSVHTPALVDEIVAAAADSARALASR